MGVFDLYIYICCYYVFLYFLFCRFTCSLLLDFYIFFFFFQQKTSYEMRIIDLSSDVCSSDLSFAGKSRTCPYDARTRKSPPRYFSMVFALAGDSTMTICMCPVFPIFTRTRTMLTMNCPRRQERGGYANWWQKNKGLHYISDTLPPACRSRRPASSNSRSTVRSEEHTSELQSLMRISYAVFCLKKKK